MEKGMVIVSLLLATTVQAGELKITETDAGITAEYTGAPADKSGESAKPPPTSNTPDVKSVEYRTSQTERWENDATGLSTVTGDETEDALMSGRAPVDSASHKIDMYSPEIRQITGNAQPATARSAQPAATSNTQPGTISNVQAAMASNPLPNAADDTPQKVESIADQRNKRQAMKNDVRAQKEALIKYLGGIGE